MGLATILVSSAAVLPLCRVLQILWCGFDSLKPALTGPLSTSQYLPKRHTIMPSSVRTFSRNVCVHSIYQIISVTDALILLQSDGDM